MEKKYVKTLYATSETELYDKMKYAFKLGFIVEVTQNFPVALFYEVGQKTFKIKLFIRELEQHKEEM